MIHHVEELYRVCVYMLHCVFECASEHVHVCMCVCVYVCVCVCMCNCMRVCLYVCVQCM